MEGLDDLPEANSVIESARSLYDTVVLDCGSAYGRWNLSAAMAADELILVTTNELSSLQAAQRLLAWYDGAFYSLAPVAAPDAGRFLEEVGRIEDSLGALR